MGIHVAEIISTGTREAWHGVQFQGEYRLVIDRGTIDNGTGGGIPCPLGGMTERRLTIFRGLILTYLRQFQGKTLLGNHIRHVVFVIHRERLTPIALA
jgi:hypothetical protein